MEDESCCALDSSRWATANDQRNSRKTKVFCHEIKELFTRTPAREESMRLWDSELTIKPHSFPWLRSREKIKRTHEMAAPFTGLIWSCSYQPTQGFHLYNLSDLFHQVLLLPLSLMYDTIYNNFHLHIELVIMKRTWQSTLPQRRAKFHTPAPIANYCRRQYLW